MKLTSKQKTCLILSDAYGIGVGKFRKLTAIDGIEELSENVAKFRKDLLEFLSEKDYTGLCLSVADFNAAALEKELEEKGIRYVCYFDKEYPEALRVYDDAPMGLYCKGDVALLNVACFAVIGTRNPTKYGARATEDFVRALSTRFCIVSGLARGVDGIAHKTTLEAGGKTIAVLGCGADVVYPPENKALYDRIARDGLLVSEYKPGEIASAHNFPARNRIISGMSRAVLVTEAGENSGTVITMNCAVEQGKDVFCIPGSIYNKMSAGCNRAIKECQTRLALCVNDIYAELGLPEAEEEKPQYNLKEDEQLVFDLLTKNGEMHFEEMVAATGYTTAHLTVLLIKLSSYGLVTKTKYNNWSL